MPEPPHVAGGVHVPQSSVPPQPSPMAPQFAPTIAQVSGVHIGLPQTPGVPPPPQVVSVEQVPQSIKFPQPSPV